MQRRDRDVDRRIGLNIRVLLTAQGKRSADLVAFLNVDKSVVSRHLSGETPFTASALAGIADWLGVEPGLLYLSTEELVRVRCFSPFGVDMGEEQLVLSFDPPAELLAV